MENDTPDVPVSDDPQGGAPPAPPDDDAPVFVSAEELQARADAFEATLGEGGDEGGEGEGEKPAAAADKDDEGEPGAPPTVIEKLLQQNAEILDQLKAQSSAAGPGKDGESKDPFTTARADSPEIKQLDADIAATEKEILDYGKSNDNLLVALGKAQADVLRLEGSVEAADPEDKPAFRSKLEDARRERDRINTQIDHNEHYKKLAASSLSSQKQLRTSAEANLRRTVAEKQEQSQQFQVEVQTAKAEIDQAFLEEAKAYGVDPKSPLFSRLYRDVRNEIHIFTRARAAEDPNAPGLDLPKAVKHLFAKASEAYNFGRRQELTDASAAKRASRAGVAKPGTRIPAAVAAAGDGRRKWTLEEVRARRDFIISGGSPTS